MWCQLSTGRDSFRAQNNPPAPKRNVSVSTYVRVKDDGEGNQVIPLFAAYQKRLKGFAKTSVVSVIPATTAFAGNDVGQWFVNRHEILPGTEILIEYRHRGSVGFRENIDYLLLIADPNAPLWQLRIDLPNHPLSNVPAVFFEGRFELLTADNQLDKASVAAWRKFLGAEGDYQLADYMDASMEPEDRVFAYIELEGAVQAKAKVEVRESEDGKTSMRIRRLRKIKVR